jgi:hypothetical protein
MEHRSAAGRSLAAGLLPAWSQQRFDSDRQQLLQRELRYFQQAGACGHCGASGDLSDPDWLNFLSYIQYKAIARQVPQELRWAPASAAAAAAAAAAPAAATAAAAGSSPTTWRLFAAGAALR